MVVPYNPYLLRTFNYHIDVCGTIKSIKYLFKYIYMGHYRASVAVREVGKADNEGNVDEIKQYRDTRWVTPRKAMWRIYIVLISARTIHLCSSCSYIFQI